MAEQQQQPVFVLTLEAVRWGVAELRAQKIHPFFLAYLHLRQQAVAQGTQDDIQPEWGELGEYLRVKDGPAGKPYYRPFWNGKSNDPGRYWLNPNLAGSYAPSSLRVAQAPYNVIDTVGAHFSLKPGHADLALRYLLYDKPVSAIAMAAFLYRDFGFVAARQPEPGSLAEVFGREFHYMPEDREFDTLFTTEAPAKVGAWFTLLEEATEGVE